MRPRRFDTREDALEMLADEVPDGGRIQLLRSAVDPTLKQGRYTRQGDPCFVEMGVHAGQRDRRLSGMFGAPAHRGHQPRSAGDRLASCFRVGQANEQTPPVVDQRHPSCRQLATVQVVRGEAAPAPLVLQLIERVLGIRAIPVELAQAENLIVGVGHQHGVLIAGNTLSSLSIRLDKRQQLLALILPGHHDPAFSLPAGERKLAIFTLPTLTRVRPVRLAKQTANVALETVTFRVTPQTDMETERERPVKFIWPADFSDLKEGQRARIKYYGSGNPKIARDIDIFLGAPTR